MSEGLAFKSFVSETELNEKRQKRQEEWEKVRTADQPEVCPEEEYDNRSLYDRLQEQKDKKQAEYDDQHQFKNMVRGLDDDESKFLDEVAERQMELDLRKKKEEQDILNEVEEYKNRVLSVDDGSSGAKTSTLTGQKKLADRDIIKKKSQASLLAGAVKRKKSEASEETDAKKSKSSTEDSTSPSNPEATPSQSENPHDKNGTAQEGSEVIKTGGQAEVVAVLPGLGHYTNSDDSDTSESSDSEVDLMGPLVRNIIKKKKIHSH